MPDPVSLASTYLPYALAAAAMSGVNLYVLHLLLPRGGGLPSLARGVLVGYVLLASSVFWIGLPWALLYPSTFSWIFVIQLMMPPMAAPFLWMIAAFYRAEERSIAPGSWSWATLVAGALLANEFFMAVSFTIALGGSVADLGGLVAASIDSVWFIVPMLATMSLLIQRAPLEPVERWALGGLTVSGVVGPILEVSGIAAALTMAIVMGGTFGLLFRAFRRGGPPSVPAIRTAIFVTAGFAVMGTGELLSGVAGAWLAASLPFATAVFGVMLAESWSLVARGIRAGPEGPRLPVAPPILAGDRREAARELPAP